MSMEPRCPAAALPSGDRPRTASQPARSNDASLPRCRVVDEAGEHEVFEVLASSATQLTVRSALLFEVGEELTVRIEQGGATSEATVRVRAHGGPADAPVTELEIDRDAGRGAGG